MSQTSHFDMGREQIVRWPHGSAGSSGGSPARVGLGRFHERIEVRALLYVLAGGMVLGAAAGLGTIASFRGASGLALEAAAFFTSPILVGLFHAELSQRAAHVTLALGSLLLYSAYAFVVFDRRGRRVRLVWLTSILTVHGVCLMAWVGLILKATIRAL